MDEHSSHGKHNPNATDKTDMGHEDQEPVEEQSLDKAVHGREERSAESDHSKPLKHDAHKGHGGHGSGGAHVDHSGHEMMFRRRFWVCLVLSIPVLLYSPMLQQWFGYSMPTFTGSRWMTPIIAVIIFIYGGVPFLRMAIPEIRNGKPGMMTLISLAIGVAFIYSLAALFLPNEKPFFWELVTLIDIMLLGHWIEMRSVRQASGALQELAKLVPDTTERLLPDGETEEIPTTELRKGDRVLVRPGSAIPADGEVEEGESGVNEAMITGESKPVVKEPGAKVIGGSINGDGSLRVKITATGDETALAGIMKLIEEAQQSKSATQLLADRASGWLFYIALSVAVITGIVWGIAYGFNVDVISRVATVLVTACPHALGLAIPLVIAITTSLGAANGILVRDRSALEQARNINTVVFDKTGTLTKGEFGVSAVAVTNGWTEEKALGFAAAAEGDSEHTIAKGIRHAAEEKGLDLPSVTGFEAIQGRGLKAHSNGHVIHLGGPRLIEALGAQLPSELSQFTEDRERNGETIVYLFQDEKPVAAFALADMVRDESKEAVRRLHDMGIGVTMLTGDSEAVARSVAEQLGIDDYFAQVLPENKDSKIAELQGQDKTVAMVGDGVNDAPALSRADIGIAIGGGTDVAIESAGIILIQNNPLDVVKAIELSRASYRKMKQNLFWATGYNVVALPLAAGVLAPWGFVPSPALGAVFMSISTIVVAVNAQFLRRLKL